MPGVPRWPLTIKVVIVDWKAAPPGAVGRQLERREGLAQAAPSRRFLSWQSRQRFRCGSRHGSASMCAGPARVDRFCSRFYNRSPAYSVGMAELVDALG
jgi:hypothetical protein